MNTNGAYEIVLQRPRIFEFSSILNLLMAELLNQDENEMIEF